MAQRRKVRRRPTSKKRDTDLYGDDLEEDDVELDEDDDEEEEDDRPRRRTRPSGRPRSRARDDDDDDDDDDEDEEPRRGRRARSRDDDDDDDEDERPSRRRASRSRRDDDDDDDDADDADLDRAARSYRTGWSGAKKVRDNTSSFAAEFKMDKDPQLIIFLSDEPIVSYGQHWIERKGKKSWTCTETDDCPLCALGDRPRAMTVFSIAKLEEDEEPTPMILIGGPRLTDTIEAAHNGRYGPIDEGYWELSSKGKGTSVQYPLENVPERDVEEDYGVEPLSDKERNRLIKAGYEAKDAVQFNTKAELREVAREIED